MSQEVPEPEALRLVCDDGVSLGGHLWRRAPTPLPGHAGIVVVNPATGVLARYYHRYARFLQAQGFDVLTYDYRGVGASRPARLRGCGFRWSDWGLLDFDAALRVAREQGGGPLLVVGHSIGGFLPGLAERAPLIDRMLTVGAQFAYWRDYDASRRVRLFLKWHVAMPLVTALCGYFPGKRLGWLEDLPAGVVREWSFRRARMERNHRPDMRETVLRRFTAVRAPILAIGVSDDELGTPQAIRRGLSYYRNADTTEITLAPAELGVDRIGHFGLFHDRHAESFWTRTVPWLRDGRNPWAS